MKLPRHYRLKLVAVAAALAFAPVPSQAAGLGKITVLSALGQPLKAELEITGTREELNSISAKVASADAFRVAGIDYAAVLTSLRFSREIRERNGRNYLLLSSDRPLNEPFIDMLVELNWASGRLVREYTFLLDPPESMRSDVPVQAPDASVAAGQATAKPVQPPSMPSAASMPEATKPAAVAKAPSAQPRAAAPSSDGATRTVRSGDTLGKIAAEVRPEGVSLDQMLVALFRSNSEAFDGNMNRLRAGRILAIPDAAAAKSIDATEARREVVTQAADFGAYRRKLADSVAAAKAEPEAPGRTSRGTITPRVEEKLPAAPAGKDKLEVSATEMSVGKPGAKAVAKDAGGTGRAGKIEEDLVARERALQEANARIAQLEKNLGDLKKLAELKSESAAKLQAQAEAAKAPPAAPAKVAEPAAAAKPAAPAPAAAQPPALPTPPAAAKPAEAPKAEVPASAAAPAAPPAATPAAGDVAKPEAPKPAPAPAPAPAAPKKKPLPPPEPEPEPDFLEENAPLVFGGAGLVSLLLGYLGLAAYRRKKAAAQGPAISKEELSANSVFSQTASDSIHSTAAGSDLLSVADAAPEGSAGPVDPLVEADTYLAFGRDTQAEDILIEALKAEPARHAIHVKLLEIYSARRSPMQFNNLARDLYEQTGGQGSSWERVVALGAALDPTNPLYGAGEQTLTAASVPQLPPEEPVSAPALDPDATMVFKAPEAAPAAALPEEAPVAPAPVAPEAGASLDFDLDLGSPATASPEPAAEPAGEIAALDFDLDLGTGAAVENPTPADGAGTSALALDIDFDLGTAGAPAAAGSAPAIENPAAAAESIPALDIDFGDTAVLEAPAVAEAAPDAALDISLELPSLGTAGDTSAIPEIPSAPAAPATPADAPVDFNFDLGEPLASAEAPAPALDLGGLSLELDAPAIAEAPQAPEVPAPLPSLEPAATAAEPAGEDPAEVATKLELALAYEEMGDLDGARELLEEVVKEGSPAQREAAEAKLAALG